MAIAFDTGSTGEVAPGTSLTISHTVGAGSDRVLFVCAVSYGSTDYLSGATVTYGGTSLGSPVTTPAGAVNQSLYVWKMVAPPSGTANIVITPTASAYVIACGVSASGVDQTTPVSTTAKDATAFGVSPYSKSISSVSGGTVLDFLFYRNTGASSTAQDASQTQAARLVGSFPTSLTASYKADPVTAMQWTFTNSGTAVVAWTGLSLAAAAASPTSATLTGPTTGTTGSASSSFTVTLDVVATSTVTITPAGTVGTVTFSPSSPTITAGNTSTTFTANADTDGTHSISITTSPTLTYSGSPISYVTTTPSGSAIAVISNFYRMMRSA